MMVEEKTEDLPGAGLEINGKKPNNKLPFFHHFHTLSHTGILNEQKQQLDMFMDLDKLNHPGTIAISGQFNI